MSRGILLLLLFLLLVSCGGGNVAVTQTGNPSQVSLYTQLGGKKDSSLVAVSQRQFREEDDDDEDEEITSITFTAAKIVVEEVELIGQKGELSFHGEKPYIINIALDSSRQVVDSIEGKIGYTYESAELFLSPLDEDKDCVSVDDTGLVGYSIFVAGYVNDNPLDTFTFKSDIEKVMPLELDAPFVVNQKGTSALFINLDIRRWFQDDDGELFNPKDDDFHDDIEEMIDEGIFGSEEDEDDWDDEDEDDEDDEKDEEEEDEDHEKDEEEEDH